LPQHANRAARGRHETEHGAHQRGFARAVRPEHTDEFALVYHEAGVAQNRAATEFERHVLEFEHGRRAASAG
jgi:hypothetical protein